MLFINIKMKLNNFFCKLNTDKKNYIVYNYIEKRGGYGVNFIWRKDKNNIKKKKYDYR
ncbi:hypothetical protein JSCD14_19980 [Clostridioides difficile]|nr:hypothetical protein JSCD1_22170 [Clostridioides difficile]GMK70674.1 hypothetical protein JSCD3_34720 [Clostridioides difficile]GMK74072.1 hypothetical protein JSCD4_32460 [Clostridioides difficile]GMK88431.1 hypothetical protein JSCD8_33500 [Clostridioides difficile]GMK88707.1 hypothetical protein JSCD9_01250 [Clostridioides difficile]